MFHITMLIFFSRSTTLLYCYHTAQKSFNVLPISTAMVTYWSRECETREPWYLDQSLSVLYIYEKDIHVSKMQWMHVNVILSFQIKHVWSWRGPLRCLQYDKHAYWLICNDKYGALHLLNWLFSRNSFSYHTMKTGINFDMIDILDIKQRIRV